MINPQSPHTLFSCLCCMLCNPEDDKFSRPQWCDSDIANQPSRHHVVLAHGGRSYLHKIRLGRRGAGQHTVSPQMFQEVSNRLLNSCPESGVIRLKYHPVGAGLNALFHKDKKPSDIDVAERGIAAGRSRPPDADALARQRAD